MKEEANLESNTNEKEVDLERLKTDFVEDKLLSKNENKKVSVLQENQSFVKNQTGIVLFITPYVITFFQVLIVVTNTESFSKLQISFFTSLFLAIICHIRAGTQNPGRITHQNNRKVLSFYHKIRENAINRAGKTQAKLEKILYPFSKNNDNVSNCSSFDSNTYQNASSITNEEMEKLGAELGLYLNRCKQCYVVRVKGTHHCTICKSCILKNDSHCPWINNCVAHFNQKFYILYCFYCVLTLSIALYIGFYLGFIKGYFGNMDRNMSLLYFFAMLIQIFSSFLIIQFSMCMLVNQINLILDERTLTNKKKKKVMEYRTIFEILTEIFGSKNVLGWFLPITTGGYFDEYSCFESKSS